MSSEPARYDAIADWYIEFTKDWDSEPLALRPDDLRGLRSWTWPVATARPAGTWPSEGRESVVLISRPPCCPGTAAGSRPAPRDPLRPQRRRLHRLVGRCGLRRRAVQHGAHGHRRPGGHPLHRRRGARPGWVVQLLGVPPALSGRARGIVVRASEPPEHGYAWEGRWSTDGKGIRDRAGVNHRMLSTYLNAVLRAGLVLEELAKRETSACHLDRSLPTSRVGRSRC